MQILSAFNVFLLVIKKITAFKSYFNLCFSYWILLYWPNYGSESRKRYILRVIVDVPMGVTVFVVILSGKEFFLGRM